MDQQAYGLPGPFKSREDITWDGEDFPSIGLYFLIKAATAIPVYRE
jgi:hypothetical protein